MAAGWKEDAIPVHLCRPWFLEDPAARMKTVTLEKRHSLSARMDDEQSRC